MRTKYLHAIALSTVTLLSAAPVLAQQGPAGCASDQCLYAQDAVQQGKIDANLLLTRIPQIDSTAGPKAAEMLGKYADSFFHPSGPSELRHLIHRRL